MIEFNTNLYIEGVMRRLVNFERTFDEKIHNFHRGIMKLQKRCFLCGDDHIQKLLKKKEQENALNKAVSLSKTVATIVLSISSLLIIKTLNQMITLKLSIDSVYLEIYYRARTAALKRQKYKRTPDNESKSEGSIEFSEISFTVQI